MKKKIIFGTLLTSMLLTLTGCASCDRAWKDMRSDLNNGLDRIVTVYTANGDILAQYEGKIDFEPNEGGYIKFDFQGKRYIYYNCFIEAIEK